MRLQTAPLKHLHHVPQNASTKPPKCLHDKLHHAPPICISKTPPSCAPKRLQTAPPNSPTMPPTQPQTTPKTATKTTATHLHHVPHRASHAPLQNCHKTTVATSRHHPPRSGVPCLRTPPPSPLFPSRRLAATVCFCFLKPNWIMIVLKMYSTRMFNLDSSSFFVYNRKNMIIGGAERKSTE